MRIAIALLFTMALSLKVSAATIHVPQDQPTRSTASETDTIWSLLLGGDQAESIESILPMSTGNYLACGFTNSYGAGGNDWYLVMLSDAGDTIWTRTHGGIGGDYAFDAAEMADSGFVVAGSRLRSCGHSTETAMPIRPTILAMSP